MKPLLLKHLSGEPIGRFPVWAMRQAGRYLPMYRAIRGNHSFWEMVTTPDLAAQVSLTPLASDLPVDAIIFFSDILTLPFGLGIPIEMQEGVGPVATVPLRSSEEFALFDSYDPGTHTPYVEQAMAQVREKVPPQIAVLGFAGAPWTVASYLTEGGSGRKFEAIRAWMHRDSEDLARALEKLASATVRYLVSQAHGGAQMVQLFDTWLSEMPRAFFIGYYLPILNAIFESLRREGIPTVFYSRHAHHLLDDFGALQCDVLSTDELLPVSEIDRRTAGKFFIQGNLDPLLLSGPEALVRRQTRILVGEARRLKRPAVLNLGHGILPGSLPQNVKAFFEEARQLWV